MSTIRTRAILEKLEACEKALAMWSFIPDQKIDSRHGHINLVLVYGGMSHPVKAEAKAEFENEVGGES